MSRMYSTRDVMQITGLSRSSLHRYQEVGIMPRGIRLTRRCVKWNAEEIDNWVAAGCPRCAL